ncbi:superinfection immunity protein [Terriglobus roseus]|uniref:Superinfection immunity protein n=1 Tax=Terriglobus roseus TaxID=392734 RepID=A0A1H4LYB3_9BACT|nr:superinfection immunity protein [Terriglobus roseus]SEB75703.1 Superinfection immunity protein [Terriglobus roseus]
MITFALLCVLYFLPSILAARRGHGVAGVLLLNLLFGWTGIGWAAMMVWALLSMPRSVYMPVPYGSPYIRGRCAQWERF